jgi:hypothetical protein
MKRIRIKLGIIGYLPFEFNRKTLKNWKSNVFEIVDEIDDFHFTNDSDILDWSFSDKLLSKELPIKYDGDFFVGITYVPIEDNFYSRRLDNNRLVLSYFEIYQVLKTENIPVENFLLRTLYASCLVYLRNEQSIPESTDWLGYTHDDTRGCLFDMNGNKIDVIFSLDPPTICDDCINKIRIDKVPDSSTNLIKKEIKRIKKGLFYKITQFVREKPILSIFLSAVFGILISLTASVIYGATFNRMKNSQLNKMSIPMQNDSVKVQKENKNLNGK